MNLLEEKIEFDENEIELEEKKKPLISFLVDDVDIHLLTTQSFCIAMKKFLGE